jgi:hypothetical protein
VEKKIERHKERQTHTHTHIQHFGKVLKATQRGSFRTPGGVLLLLFCFSLSLSFSLSCILGCYAGKAEKKELSAKMPAELHTRLFLFPSSLYSTILRTTIATYLFFSRLLQTCCIAEKSRQPLSNHQQPSTSSHAILCVCVFVCFKREEEEDSAPVPSHSSRLICLVVSIACLTLCESVEKKNASERCCSRNDAAET